MNNFFIILGIISTIIVSIWATLKYLILGTYKIDNDLSKRLIDRIEKEATVNWILTGEYVQEPRYPDTYETIVYLKGALFFLSRSERLLTAGWKGKEELTLLVFPRWYRKKILDIIKNQKLENSTIPIMALTTRGADKLGELSVNSNPEIFIDPKLYLDIELDISDVISGKKSKTGFLLHGAPGNGKTQFVKYIARKFSLPIYVIYLNPDYDNLDIATMFASIPQRCLVLMEDFDNYFDGRKCIIKNDQVKFTFDALINSLDGVHNDYRQVIFAMTVNNIKKVDNSLANRPSRFKFVRKFNVPTDMIRLKILGDKELVDKTKNMSLDQVFNYRHL